MTLPFAFRGIAIQSSAPDYDQPYAQTVIDQVAGLGANWASVVSATHFDRTSGALDWTSALSNTADAIGTEIARLHARGLRVALTPHMEDDHGHNLMYPAWTPADPAAFFRQYKAMALYYAGIAERAGAEMLTIGTELGPAITGAANRSAWVDIIAAIRQVYHGALTYSAGGDASAGADGYDFEAAKVSFWDLLDYVGVNAYAQLDEHGGTADQFVADWHHSAATGTDIAGTITAFANQVARPVIFTEIGWRNLNRSAEVGGDFEAPGTPDPAQQASLWDATFRVWSGAGRWLRGLIGWDVSANPADAGPPFTGYDMVGQPAGTVIRGWFAQAAVPVGAFDAARYRARYADVAAAGIDPLSHYLSTGWTEGRRINDEFVAFDPAWYLAHNPDVAAAGIAPAAHYALAGWREGRAPSADFDGRAYLAAYPDVAASGLDPLRHYLLAGMAEGRSAFPVAVSH